MIKLKFNILVIIMMISLVLLLSQTAYAQETHNEGLSGHIFTGAVYCTGDMSLNDAHDDNHIKINSLSQSSENLSEFGGVVTGQLNYTFNTNGTTIGIGNADGPLMVHLEQPVEELGVVFAGVYMEEEEVWADPYKLGSNRQKTDQETIGFVIGLDQIYGKGFSLFYNISRLETDKDLSGLRDARLKRDGTIHSFTAVSVLYHSGKHQWDAGLTGTITDLSGKSYSYHGISGELSYTYQQKFWDIQSSISVGGRYYDETHPEFNREREDLEAGFETALTVYDPFGFEKYFVTAFGAVSAVDSNIGFFSSNQLCLGLGVGYAF